MDLNVQYRKARDFAALHRGPGILVLPNAWDVASARIFEEAGFPAIATTSGGIANSLGYPDGERIGRDEMLRVVQRISHAVSVPVSADMEAGYGKTPVEVAETAKAVIAAGAIGMNFEDGTGRPGQLEELPKQIENITAIREASAAAGIPLVLNARTDVYLDEPGEPSDRLAEALRRANAYREAGADCLFVPGIRDEGTIRECVLGIHAPVNILVGFGTPSVRELERMGVARVSVGSGPMRATLALLQRIARELRETGMYTAFIGDTISYEDANRLFEKPAVANEE